MILEESQAWAVARRKFKMSTQRLEDCRRGLPEQLVEGERESLAERSLNLASGCRKKGVIATTVQRMMKEFCALLVARAERCMVRAELCRNETQRKAWLKEADCALQRKTKLQQSSKNSYVEKLIQWLGAAYLHEDVLQADGPPELPRCRG